MPLSKFVNLQKIVKQPSKIDASLIFVRKTMAKCELPSYSLGDTVRIKRSKVQETKEKKVLLAIFILLSAIAIAKQFIAVLPNVAD